jgi:hypothetical protein
MALEYVCEASGVWPRSAVLPRVAVTSGPLQQGIGPGLIAQRGAPRAAGYAACRQGAGADCDADREGSDPSSRGFRPSQRSQASPRPPAPRALGCASPISWRCRRQAMASNVIGAPCSVVSSHRIIRKCGGGFIGSSQSRTAVGLDGQALRPRLAAARFHAGSPDQGPDVVPEVESATMSPVPRCTYCWPNINFRLAPALATARRTSMGRRYADFGKAPNLGSEPRRSRTHEGWTIDGGSVHTGRTSLTEPRGPGHR